ncbi:MAG: CorA family divalent cation transporter [Candidatus Woesearchaeota archaeon]
MIRYFITTNKGLKVGEGKYETPKKGQLAFIFLTGPTREETDQLAKDFSIKKDIFSEYMKIPYSRRYSSAPFAFVMKDYFVENNETQSGSLLFVITHNYMIVVASKESRYYRKLFDSSVEKLNCIKPKSIGHILYTFLQEDVEDNYEVLEMTEELISDLEKEVNHYETERLMDVDRIITHKRKLFRIGRQFWASTKIISALRSGSAQIQLDKESSLMLADIYETFLHQIDVVNSQKDMLSDVLTIHSTNVNNRLATISNSLNTIMKRLTAYTLILMFPTFVASAYGMNLPDLPLAHSAHSFWTIMGGTVIFTLIMFYIFRSRKWL